MSTILKHIAVAFGAAIFIAVAVIGFVREVPFFIIVFRGVIAMSIATVVFLSFAIFFQRLLYRFVAEKIMEQRRGPGDDARRQEAGSAGGASAASGAPASSAGGA